MHFEDPIKKIIRLVLALSFAVIVSGVNPSIFVQAQNKNTSNFSRFELLTVSSGWVLLEGHLFWTSDVGQTWREIGPSIPNDALIQDVEFKDADTGWILWTIANPDGGAEFQLAHTTNNGITWRTHPLSLFEPGEIAANAEKAEMGWFDGQTGWISVKQNSGSNFSIGVLFTTSDGGITWSRSNLPVADKIYFRDPQSGWAVGGPANDQLFETRDAGASWEKIQPADIPDDSQTKIYSPFFSGEQGLVVMTHLGEEHNLNAYRFENSSDEWLPIGDVKLAAQFGNIGLSILDARNFVAAIPGTNSIVRMTNGELNVLENQDGLSASIVELDMASLDVGWGKSVEASCVTTSLSDHGTGSISCSSATRLVQTTDGGITWQTLNLPDVHSDIAPLNASGMSNSMAINAISGLENTAAFVGQGFDKCEIPTLSQMQTWWNSSPYKTVNLYIGGSSRTCTNSALTPSYLFRLSQQGWRFIPTWVGPQAPCTGFPSRMSSDVTVAYAQGVSEANLAVDRLAALGLTDPDKTGSVVYYDIEAYGTDAACRAAVNSFMNGWVSQIHARGSLAGVYGSTLCNTGLSDFQSITNVPDVIWPARWYHNLGSGFYDPTANVWNLGSCIPNAAWSNHQRIRQYEGDHNETWGGLPLTIDSDVLDGVVAIRHDYPFVDNILRTDPDPTNAATVAFTINFSEAVTGVNKGDFALKTTGISNASILSVSGSGSTYSVTIDTGSGNRKIRLDLVDNNTIIDDVDNPLGGVGSNNGNYTSGEAYTINKSLSVDTTGVFRPGNGLLYLKNSNITGFADVALNYGLGGDYPVVGDWDGDGDATIGVYRDGSFYLRNSNTIGFAELVFAFATPGDQPIAGDWDGDGVDTAGVYRPSTGQFLLRNSNTDGSPELSFYLGNVGDVGIAGDWDGDGIDTTGVFRPSNGIIFLKNTNETGFADVALNYGLPGDQPVTGDWDNDGVDTIGVYRNGSFYLRNENTIGFAEIIFGLGNPGDMPIAGNWDGLP
jgi:photosystem II stability/assembly factor-like uncharacterized protein